MRFKGHRNRFAAVRPSPPHNFAQHMGMRAVHTVEISHAEKRRPELRGNIFEFMEDLHSEIGSQISNSSFNPSYDNRTCGGNIAFVASCGRSWQICVKNARFAFTRSTMRNEFSTVECVGCGLCRSASRKRRSSPSS